MSVVRIRHLAFHLSDPYQAGQPLSVEEARVLNNLRGENIRNRLLPTVREALAGVPDGGWVSPAAIAALQRKARDIDEAYSFSTRKAYRRVGQLEAEVADIARALVLARARQDGLSLSEAELAEAIRVATSDPAVIEEASARVAERQRVSTEKLEDLL